MASIWEIGIKTSIGKLNINGSLEEVVIEMPIRRNIAILGIDVVHILKMANLPHHHRDPFDRMIIAQALVEGLPIVSTDAQFDAYGIQRVY